MLKCSHGFGKTRKPTMYQNHQWIKTVCTIYAGPQKDTKSNWKKFPAGTKGQIRHTELDKDVMTWYYLIRIPVQSAHDKDVYYWAKLNESCITCL